MKKTIRVMTIALLIALLTAMLCGAVAERVAVSNGLRLNIKVREEKKEEKEEKVEEAAPVEETGEQPAEETAEAEVEQPAEPEAEPAIAVSDEEAAPEETVVAETEEAPKAETKATEETASEVTAEQAEANAVEAEAEIEEEEERSAMVILPDSENEIALYAQADTASAIVGMIPAGAMVGARRISGEWSYISYEGMTGYVHTAGIALFNADAKEEEKVRSIRIVNDLNGQSVIQEGTMLTLTAKLSGFEGDSYTFQWSESADGSTFRDMPGETGQSVSFPLTRDNISHLWHVTVTLTDKDA